MFIIMHSKVGWIVQNGKTSVIVAGPYPNRDKAVSVADKLNGVKK